MQGFFYNKFPEPKKGDLGTETDINLNQQLCYHVLGQPQSKDAVVWACPDHPAWMLGAEVSDDGRWAVALLHQKLSRCPIVPAQVAECGAFSLLGILLAG